MTMNSSPQTSTGAAGRRRGSSRIWPCAPFPIRTGKDHAQAIAILDQLVPLDRPTPEERDFIDIMIPGVETYESRHHAIDTSAMPPLELLRSLLNDHGLNAADLGRLLGNRSLGSAILRGERKLSKRHITILAERFKLDPGVFL